MKQAVMKEGDGDGEKRRVDRKKAQERQISREMK